MRRPQDHARDVAGGRLISFRRQMLWIALILVPPGYATAWDADGFLNGDTITKVEKELGLWGVNKLPRVPQGGMKGAYSISAMGRWFTFCQDRLYEYDRQFEGTVPTVSLILQTEIDRRGQPTIGTGPVTVNSRGIWFTWLGEGEIFQLIVGQEDRGRIEITRRHTDLKLKKLCLGE